MKIDPDVLKRILPQRLSFAPGLLLGDSAPPLLTYIECGHTVVSSLVKLFRVTNHVMSRKSIERRLPRAGSVVRAAVRNGRYPVAACVSDHTPDANTVLRYTVHPAYRGEDIDLHLLYLAALEMPECPTLVWVRESNVPRQRRLSALGWKADRVEHRRIRFVHAPLARLVDPAGAAGGPPDSPAAGG